MSWPKSFPADLGRRALPPLLFTRTSCMTRAARPEPNATAPGPATSLLPAWITEGVRSAFVRWPRARSDAAPVSPTQYLVLPGPPVDGPVTQLERPAGPPAPACATHSPSRVSVRCRGLLSPLRSTLTLTFPGAALAAAGMASPARTAAPVRAAAAIRRCTMFVPSPQPAAPLLRRGRPGGPPRARHQAVPGSPSGRPLIA